MRSEQRAAEQPGSPGERGRPRVLVLAESLPYPTLKGGDLRNWQNVNALLSFAEVGVFGLCSNDSRRVMPPGLPLAFWESSTDPALSYPPPKGVRLAGRAWLLDPDGHPSDLFFSAAAASEIATVLERFRPDVVLIEGVWLHAYIKVAQAAGCACVLDCHNIEAALVRELAAARRGDDLESRVVRDVIPARTETLERRAVHNADHLWVCSEEDARRLIELYTPAAPVYVVPNGVRVTEVVPVRDPAALTLLFMGFYPHAPNAIAAEFLVREVFPRLVAECAQARLMLVGAKPPALLHEAARRDPRIMVTGALQDVGPALAQATALVVPLFQGSGTRLKVLEAFAASLPVISTQKGVEGLEVRDGEHILMAETAAKFVEAALAVWRDPALAQRLAASARKLVTLRYSWEAAGACIRQALSPWIFTQTRNTSVDAAGDGSFMNNAMVP